MWYDVWIGALRSTVMKVHQNAPAVVAAVLLVLLGWALAWLLARVGKRVAERILDALSSSRFVDDAIDSSGVRSTAPRVFAGIVSWAVFLLFLAAAVEVLGLPVMTNLVGQVAAYLPNLLAAAVIFLAAVIAARIARAAVTKAARAAGIPQATGIANVVHGTIFVIAVVIALEQLGIKGRVLELTVAVTVGSTLAAAALAFGLGARQSVANIISARYVAQFCRVGQAVRIDGIEGTVVQLTTTAVIVEAEEGRVVIPAAHFHDSLSVMLSGGP